MYTTYPGGREILWKRMPSDRLQRRSTMALDPALLFSDRPVNETELVYIDPIRVDPVAPGFIPAAELGSPIVNSIFDYNNIS